MTELCWKPYNETDIPLETLCLFECEAHTGKIEYHSGEFHPSNGGSDVLGIIGGHFSFARKILRWANIEFLIPTGKSDAQK